MGSNETMINEWGVEGNDRDQMLWDVSAAVLRNCGKPQIVFPMPCVRFEPGILRIHYSFAIHSTARFGTEQYLTRDS